VAAWMEHGSNSVVPELTCSRLADRVRRHSVHIQQPLDLTGTWISTRYERMRPVTLHGSRGHGRQIWRPTSSRKGSPAPIECKKKPF